MQLRLARYVHLITGAYLLVTGVLILTIHQEFPRWQVVFALHLAGGALAFAFLFRWRDRQRGWLRFVRNWYPTFLFLPLYKEVEILAAVLGDWSLTQTVQAVELGLFGAHPSLWLSQRWPSLWLSELLHLCYLSYVILIPAVGGYWYFTGRRDAFQQLLLLVAAGYFASYFVYILYPVDSPYYLFAPLAGPLDQGWIYQMVHFVSDHGGARGGAFPSTHVAISTLVLLTAWGQQRRVGYMLLPLVIGIYFATIYGRFHYAVDVIAGICLAFTIWATFKWSSKIAGIEMRDGRMH